MSKMHTSLINKSTKMFPLTAGGVLAANIKPMRKMKTQNRSLSLPRFVMALALLFVVARLSNATAGTFYVSEPGANKIFTFSGSGGVATVFVSDPSLNHPYGLAVDGDGNLYSAGNSSSIINKITTNGTISTYVSGVPNPLGLAFGSGGNLYASEADGSSKVSKITPSLTIDNNFAFTGASTVPYGLATDANGNIYAACYGSADVKKITPSGSVSTYASGGSSPVGLAFDDLGFLYVSFFNANAIYKVAPGGGPFIPFVLSGLSNPYGLTFANGNLYEVDAGTLSVNQISLSGVVTPFATGFDSGIAYIAFIPEPSTCALMGAGVFVLTTLRRRMQRGA